MEVSELGIFNQFEYYSFAVTRINLAVSRKVISIFDYKKQRLWEHGDGLFGNEESHEVIQHQMITIEL